MATKAEQLKKKLIRDGIICLVLLLALAGGAYEVSDYDDQTLLDKQHQEGENTRLRSENDAMMNLLNNGSEVSGFFETYIKEHNSSFTLDREQVTKTFAELREQNHLVNLSVTISPITNVADKAFQLKTGVLVQSEVKLSFSALTDSSVYAFIEAIQRQLPGIVVVHDLKINKTGDISAAILRDLSVHKLDPLANVELSFIWLGIHANSEEKPVNGNDVLKHVPMPMLPGRNPNGT